MLGHVSTSSVTPSPSVSLNTKFPTMDLLLSIVIDKEVSLPLTLPLHLSNSKFVLGVTLIVTTVPSSYSPPDGLIVPPSVGLEVTVRVYIVGSDSFEQLTIKIETKRIITFFIINYLFQCSNFMVLLIITL